MKRTWLILLMLASSSACYRTRMTFRQAPHAEISGDYDERWHHDGVFGLAQFSDPVALDRACPAGVAEIEQRTSFVNGLVAGLTSSLYTPQTVSVYCLAAPPAMATPAH